MQRVFLIFSFLLPCLAAAKMRHLSGPLIFREGRFGIFALNQNWLFDSAQPLTPPQEDLLRQLVDVPVSVFGKVEDGQTTIELPTDDSGGVLIRTKGRAFRLSPGLFFAFGPIHSSQDELWMAAPDGLREMTCLRLSGELAESALFRRLWRRVGGHQTPRAFMVQGSLSQPNVIDAELISLYPIVRSVPDFEATSVVLRGLLQRGPKGLHFRTFSRCHPVCETQEDVEHLLEKPVLWEATRAANGELQVDRFSRFEPATDPVACGLF